MTELLRELATIALMFGVVAGVGWLLWWLLIESEGVYLGRRVVIALYDLYAGRYDDTKRFRKASDHQYLAGPLMQAFAPDRAPRVLDVATGTARLPIALLNHAGFGGVVFGVDLSRRMLAHGAAKLGGFLVGTAAERAQPYVVLVHAPAERLPFPDASFDGVTCLEALEFMNRPTDVLAELARVLMPGGVLLITTRISTRLMPGKVWRDETMLGHLLDAGFDNIEFETWQVDYTLVWAARAADDRPDDEGVPPDDRAQPPSLIAALLVCPRCRARAFAYDAGAWVCGGCGAHVPVGQDGVIELEAATQGQPAH
jgi:ubiquinone/menaquinone biosynthesis C-methylase UbiE